MSSRVLSYVEKKSPVHELAGVTKLVFFLLWSITAMLTYDTRVLGFMLVCSLIVFKLSKTEWKQVATVFYFILAFLTLNLLAIFFFAPEQGETIYGTCHVLLGDRSNRYYLTAEQLFYEANVMLKYFTVVPSVFMFIVATNPSEFAASMNSIGISYNVGYSMAIALRYIPDVQDDFRDIRNSQSARGIEMSSKAGLFKRIKDTSAIIFPLVFSGMERIEVISNAMELRGFGKHKKRTWYSGRPMKKADIIVIVVTVIFSIVALIITFLDGSRFFNPFV